VRPVHSLRLLALLVVLFAASALSPAIAEAQDTRPNILLIVTDDQRATETLGVMPKTLRYFRRGGRQFTNAFATTPLCCPSRASILTGRYAHNTGVRQNRVGGLDMSTLFPRRLVRNGYQTAIAGKFLNGWRRRVPHFDHWAVLNVARGAYYRPTFNVDGNVGRSSGYSTDIIGQHAIDFMRLFENQDDDAPWFLYVAPAAPHYPWMPKRRYARAPLTRWGGNPAVFERDRSDKPAYVRREKWRLAAARAVRAGQLRALMSVDDMVGRIVRKLGAFGERRDTLAVFTSDNGFIWADHAYGGAQSTAGEKRVPYRASVRVPFFLRWPGHVEAGSRDGRLVGNVDIAPTVLSATGIGPGPATPPLDGRSLLRSQARSRILLEYWKEKGQEIPTWASLRTRTSQYIEYYRRGRMFFREYYDLVRDPWQLRNLLGDGRTSNNPNVRGLHARLRLDRRCVGRGTSPGSCP
jgi:arylsulfatase A-like enzyme